jgi:GNAT superfamily N-acetyltransferase
MATSDDDLLQRYADPEADPDYQANMAGIGQLAASAVTGIGAQSARGLAMLQGQPSDFHGVPLGDAGQRLLRTAAPGFEPVSNLADSIADTYGKSVNTNAGLASKYLGDTAGAGVAAAGAVLPNFVGPAGEEKAIADAAAESIAHAAPGRVLDGLTPSALEREGVAATRGAEPPEPPGGITYSISKATDVGHPTAGLIGFHPDALVSDAHTTNGEHVGRIVMEPSEDGSMLISRGGGNGMMEWGNDAIVHPDYRGQGIGPNLVQNGIDHAHLNGMDFGSDTKLSQGGLNMYKKLESEGYPLDYNPTVVTEGDPQNGGYYASQNGQPAVIVRQPIHADDAHPEETPAPQASGWIQNQAGDQNPQALTGMPRVVNVGDLSLPVGPNPVIRQIAERYKQEAGITTPQPTDFQKVDPVQAKRIAAAYDAMPHAPNDPAVKASYDAMINETLAQYQHVKAAGLKVDFIPPGSPDPYAASPRLATEDINNNNHFWVFPTSEGFGTIDTSIHDNPLLGHSGETISGQPATNNDIFRVVHDYFGHAKEGVGFRADGEENAWRQHASMYSDLARPAMTAETRGQNNWVNFGPHGEANRGASGADTVYADQKTGVLPDEFNQPTLPQGGTHGAPAGGAPIAPEAHALADYVADNGGVTYHPGTGDLNPPGSVHVPDRGSSVSLDHKPTPDEIHDFMLQNQEPLTNGSVLHIESDGAGNHFMHVGEHEPFAQEPPPHEAEYLADNKGYAANQKVSGQVGSRPIGEYEQSLTHPTPRTEWTHGQPTVNVAQGRALHTPGVYGDPKAVVDEAAALAAQSPENPMMQRLFGVTRKDLADIGAGRQGNLLGQPQGIKGNPSGSEAVQNVMTPQNAQRLVDALEYAKTKPELAHGMMGWYVMDPAYRRIEQLTGDPEKAKQIWDQLNSFSAISSPQTPVDRELEVAGTAHWLKNSGRWSDYEGMADAAKHSQNPQDMQDLMHHIYHNSQNVPAMNRYIERGEIGKVPMQAPKAYTYAEASNTPEIGNQTMTPVGDTHFAGAMGLLDTRAAKDPKGSLETSELQTLAPWFRSQVADRAGMESVPAQALLWGIYAPQTGVRSGIGMPKLELMTKEIENVAQRYGISPEEARDHFLLGTRPSP